MPIPEGYNELAGVVWPGLRAFRFSGVDANEWLQGQVTNDLRKLTETDRVSALLVKPTGQILECLTVSRDAQGIVVVVEGGSELLSRVENFVILEDLVVEELGDMSHVLFGTEGSGFPWSLPGLLGWAVVGDLPGAGLASVDEFSAMTLETRTPVALFDADAKTFPTELGQAFDDHYVAYNKGCFFGQEVLQRIHSRGHTNREWRVLRVDREVAKGESVTDSAGTSLGLVTRCALSRQEGYLCGAMLQSNCIETDQVVRIGEAEGVIL